MAIAYSYVRRVCSLLGYGHSALFVGLSVYLMLSPRSLIIPLSPALVLVSGLLLLAGSWGCLYILDAAKPSLRWMPFTLVAAMHGVYGVVLAAFWGQLS